jgi:hypothetical protein
MKCAQMGKEDDEGSFSMEGNQGGSSWGGRLHSRIPCIRRDYVLACGIFFQRMGKQDVLTWLREW